jgi:hypothetical protein
MIYVLNSRQYKSLAKDFGNNRTAIINYLNQTRNFRREIVGLSIVEVDEDD